MIAILARQFQTERASPSDVPLIYSSWLRSYADSPAALKLPRSVYWEHQRDTIDRLLERASVIVARPAGWPEGIAGWLCCELPGPGRIVVHYAWTKARYRRMGVCNSLLKHMGVGTDGREDKTYSHLRPPWTRWFEAHGWTYDPRSKGRTA